MLKVTKMLAVLVAVSAFALSATPARGVTVNWDGPDGGLWSVTTGGGDGFGNWDNDISTMLGGGWLQVDTSGQTTICDVDTSGAPWTDGGQPCGVLARNANTVINTGTMRFREQTALDFRGNSTFKMQGGSVELTNSEGHWSNGGDKTGTVEFSGGEWLNGWIRDPALFHVIGNGTTFTDIEGFARMTGGQSGNPATSTFKWTLEAGEGISTMNLTGVMPPHNGGNTAGTAIMFGTHKKEDANLYHPDAGSIAVEVAGIQDYINNHTGPLVTEWDLMTTPVGEPDEDFLAFYTGSVDGGWGTVSVVMDGADPIGLRLDIVPEPATLALLAFGGLGVLLRRKRR